MSQPAPVSKASFVVYIDESGDEGFQFDRGSSIWFVVAAVVVRAKADLEAMKLIDRVRPKLGKKQGAEIHFRKLHHDQRLALCAEIAEQPLRWIAVAIHKPSLHEIRTERLYFYASRLLLERVTKLCVEKRSADDGDGTADVYFSTKESMSYDAFRAYVEKLYRRTDSSITPLVTPLVQIRAAGSRTLRGLQVADAVASGVWCAVNPKCGFTEPRYATMLHPRCHKDVAGRNAGFGLKFFPNAERLPDDVQPLLAWSHDL